MAAESNGGISKLADVMTNRINRQKESPLVLDFGSILIDKSLLTNTFPVKIPKGEYSVCRQLTLGPEGDTYCDTTANDAHSHKGIIPDKMRWLEPGDRVLVAWVQSEAVVIDLIEKS